MSCGDAQHTPGAQGAGKAPSPRLTLLKASSVAVSREDGPSKIAAAWHIRVCATVHRACDRTVEHSPRNVGFVLGESGSETYWEWDLSDARRARTGKTRHPDRAPVAVRTSRRPRPPVGPGRPRARPPDLCYTLLHRPRAGNEPVSCCELLCGCTGERTPQNNRIEFADMLVCRDKQGHHSSMSVSEHDVSTLVYYSTTCSPRQVQLVSAHSHIT